MNGGFFHLKQLVFTVNPSILKKILLKLARSRPQCPEREIYQLLQSELCQSIQGCRTTKTSTQCNACQRSSRSRQCRLSKLTEQRNLQNKTRIKSREDKKENKKKQQHGLYVLYHNATEFWFLIGQMVLLKFL